MLILSGAWLCGLSSVPQGSGLSRLRSSITFPTMLSGTLVGSVKYTDLYIDSNEEENTSAISSYTDHGRKNQRKIPSLPQIA